jgi:hypothetical protein
MSRIAIVSDTHIPSRATEIPDWVREQIASADHVVHAGDFDSEPAYESVSDLAADLTAVSGNMDPVSLGLPDVATLSVDGVDFVVTHGSGPIQGYEERVAAIVEDENPDAIGIAGHTHQVMNKEVDGVRILNPGSATGASPAKTVSLVVAEVEDGDVNVTIHEA